MRVLVPVVLMALAAACTDAPVGELGYRSTMDRSTLGVVLHVDGQTGHAGMSSSNCPFETVGGQVTGDYAIDGGEEDIQDEGISDLGEATVVLVKDGQAHLLDKTTGDYVHEPLEDLDNVLQARLAADGAVRLTEDCDVVFADGTAVRVSGCNEAFDVDYATGMALVGTDTDTTLLDATGAVLATLPGADWVAIDPVTEQLLLARPGAATVEAFDASGEALWDAGFDGEVSALATAGEAEGVAVAIVDAGGARLEVLDTDGFVVQRVELPEPADDLVISGDGSVIAFVTPTAVHFFDR